MKTGQVSIVDNSTLWYFFNDCRNWGTKMVHCHAEKKVAPCKKSRPNALSF